MYQKIMDGDGAQKIPGAKRHLDTIEDAKARQRLGAEIDVANACKWFDPKIIRKQALPFLAEQCVIVRGAKLAIPVRVHLTMVSMFAGSLLHQGHFEEFAQSIRLWCLPGGCSYFDGASRLIHRSLLQTSGRVSLRQRS